MKSYKLCYVTQWYLHPFGTQHGLIMSALMLTMSLEECHELMSLQGSGSRYPQACYGAYGSGCTATTEQLH